MHNFLGLSEDNRPFKSHFAKATLEYRKKYLLSLFLFYYFLFNLNILEEKYVLSVMMHKSHLYYISNVKRARVR